MPLIDKSDYCAPLFLQNGHVQSIYPTLFRRFDTDFYQRERIFTPDDDFLDIDWSRTGSNTLAIISHGLEGSSHRNYVVGMVKMLNRNGWDALAWNYRSCSGEINRQLRFYTSGTTDDLEQVIQHIIKAEFYKKIVLIGFSMGGNLTLLYLGQKSGQIDNKIERAVVFSVPCDLKASTHELAKFKNKIFMRRFLVALHKKIRAKMEVMPGQINDDGYHLIKNFKMYDDKYTAPLHGFKNAEDYWKRCSSNQFIPEIKIPTLIVNARNDPFIADGCYPIKETSSSKYVFLEIPRSGGHVGFIQFKKDKSYWSEERAIEFLKQS
ncbi:MAG: alpha/beta fold hydrolase [Candidatus Scalindua sp. AMX11]|nr:MAG: alpha/beta fold hydrolase [Candidatus Scalindua sp.]NOG85725.1 alpha/beta fold hydrolase [Planctomycetota bacterium]RZV73173.1 MAG: alpha/beta fold hydrolase [Candidatus Scalindua sp. SCAELEC01]TDE64739.1 MAG: alpha/beta fold hydrolase [Candidatus Scalindua sp. AMX11]GJQ58699.1 MAG: alpha/beta hydrolase [Candidatus Scalindua sp.]